jgi:hypothetical protein
MSLRRSSWIAAAFCITSLAACGSEPDDNPAFSSGIQRDTTLGGISDADVATLCASAQQYFVSKPSAQEAICKVGGNLIATLDSLAGTATTDEAVKMSCVKGYDQCKASIGNTNPASCRKPSSSCMATVAEYETCITDERSAIEASASGVPACDDLTLSNLRPADAGTADPFELPASCKAIHAKCPELFNSTPPPR